MRVNACPAGASNCDAASTGLTAASGFEEEPDATLGFVDPDFDEAGGGDVAGVIADAVDFEEALAGGEPFDVEFVIGLSAARTVPLAFVHTD